jgi:hypothetical protein
MPFDITDQLIAADTDHAELQVFLITLGDSTSDDSKTTYGGWIEANFRKDGSFDSLTWLHGDRPSHLADGIIQKCRDALVEGPLTASSTSVFSLQPVTHVARVDDVMQLIPAPPAAPRPEFTYADHPAFLEVSYPSSPHPHVNSLRARRRQSEMIELLTLILAPYFSAPPPTDHEWVFVGDPLERLESQYRQVSYWPKCEWPTKDELGFSVVPDVTTMATLPAGTYYDQLGVSIDQVLSIPDSFGRAVRAYIGLPADDKARFRRALHWFGVSRKVFPHSNSLAFSTLVFAIESLLPPLAAAPRCAQCGLEQRESISNRFRNFLDQHCRGIPKQDITSFIGKRSSFVHGGALMMSDADDFFFRHTAPETKQRWELDVLRQVAQVVLINWLHQAGAKPPEAA